MSKQDKNREKEFSEYIDRILAGEDVRPGDDIGEDMRTAIEFSKEMTRMRGGPSAAFREELKRKLLHELVERDIAASQQEKKAHRSYGTLWRSLTTAVIVIVLALVGVFWYIGGFPWTEGPEEMEPSATTPLQPTYTTTPAPTATTPAPTVQPTTTMAPTVAEPGEETTIPSTTEPSPTQLPAKSVSLTAAFDKETYLPGEPVTVEVTFTNITGGPLLFSPFPPSFEVYSFGGSGAVVYTFPPGDSSLAVPKGNSVTHTIVWDQRDAQGRQVPCGQYIFSVPAGGTLEDSRAVGSVYILPPEGVIERTIDVNESLTVGGVAITLEKIELTRSGPRFYAFSADYRDPGPPLSLETFRAGYSLDGGPIIETRPVAAIGGGPGVDGYQYVWFMSVPVPSGTRELTFIVTRFGDIEGPWEFTISLE